jgi:hypothetical protein
MSFWKWFSTKFHSHEWEIRRELPLKIHNTKVVSGEEHIIASGVRYVLQCKVCGEVKFRDCV